MPVVKVYPSGTSGGFSTAPPTTRGPRGEVRGWSPGAARRLLAWLWSVDPKALPSSGGLSLTLTMGGRPESAAEWTAARRAFLARMDRRGWYAHQWLTEWTSEGRPHLHMAAFVAGVNSRRAAFDALDCWLAVCDSRGWEADAHGQHIVPMNAAVGWFQYLSKHAARGVAHYQRQGIPEGWEKSGRLWGYGGAWPIAEPDRVELTAEEFRDFALQHWRYQVVRMQVEGAPVESIERMLDRDPRTGGTYDGLSGWIPEEHTARLLLSVQRGPKRLGRDN